MTKNDVAADSLVDLFAENGPYPVGRTALQSLDALGIGQCSVKKSGQSASVRMLSSLTTMPRAATLSLSGSDYEWVLENRGVAPPTVVEGW